MTAPHTAEGWVLKLARELKALHHTELHVMLALAARHNRDFRAVYSKLALLATETHISERQITRILNALQAKKILAIHYGRLPNTLPDGRSMWGNVYRFVGFDPLPDEPQVRRAGGLQRSDDTMSSQFSAGSDDTGDRDEMTSGTRSDDTGDRDEMTPATSALHLRNPVKNPVKEPGLNPVRARAREAPDNGADVETKKDERDDGACCPIGRASAGQFHNKSCPGHVAALSAIECGAVPSG